MPLVMSKIYSIKGNYNSKEKEYLESMIRGFRVTMFDDTPEENILHNKKERYSDDKIIALMERAMDDINCSEPHTDLTIFDMCRKHRKSLVIDGAIVFALMSEGLLQLRNQIDFNDSGLSIAMFNKTGIYQSWMGTLLQQYIASKQDFKSSVIVEQENSGFVGIMSEFGYRGWW